MRIFIGVNFDINTRKKLRESISTFKKSNPYANFTNLENIHLTLVFIGETSKKNEIIDSLQSIKSPKINIKIDRLGAFAKTKILYANIEKNESLNNLQRQIKSRLREIGIETEKRAYSPHITLARNFNGSREIINDSNILAFPFSTVIASFSVIKSERISGKIRYSSLKDIELL